MPAVNPTRTLFEREGLRHGPFNRFRERYELAEMFGGHIRAQTAWDDATPDQASERLVNTAIPHFVLTGTNADATDQALNVDGGLDLVTAGADNDQAIAFPRAAINSVLSTPWAAVTWEPQHETRIQLILELPAITTLSFMFGLGLTAAHDGSTDADQAKIQFSTEGAVSTTKFTALESVAGTDTETLLDMPAVVAATTTYNLEVRYSSLGFARFYVDGQKLHTAAAAHTLAAALKPVFSIQALSAAAKTVTLRQLRISRAWQDAA